MSLDHALRLLAQDVVDGVPFRDKASSTPTFQDALEAHLFALRAAGRLPTPTCVQGHHTRLEQALASLDSPPTGAYDPRRYVRLELLDWITRQFHAEGGSEVYRARAALGGDAAALSDSDKAALVDRIAARMAERLDSGTIRDQLCSDSDLVTSAWNGRRHTLAFAGWEARIVERDAGRFLRLGSVSIPMQPVEAPGTLTFDMQLRDGTLFVGSDVPGKDLAEICTRARQEVDGQGLQGELSVTDTLLRERHIVAFGVRQTGLVFVPTPTGFFLATSSFGGEEGLPSQVSLSLDYRHLALIDAHALRENLRATWDEKDHAVEPRFQEAVKAFTGKKFKITPGVYRFIMPTNHQRCISQHGRDAAVILEARRVDQG